MSGDWGFGAVLRIFFWGYLIGGLTLIPTVLVLAWYLGTTPVDETNLGSTDGNRNDALGARRQSGESTKGDDDDNSHLGLGLDEEILEKLKSRAHEPDVFAGYFAVCREYVPGGVNGKPPDRTTPAGAVVSMESPSVYQSMYRSIFDRNKSMSPTIEASNARSKKARNVFYVVLRLGHLMLYDNEDQLEVRHVISLAHYQVDVFAGGEKVPEGELWIKRNCIRLVQKLNDDVTEAKSFFLFSDNCADKEDFYHAILQAQEHHKDHTSGTTPPVPLKFETPDLVKLVQQLHASEENLHTRWINALIGRIFLALYKTSEVKNFIANKINKKIARVPKPALISSVQLQKVDMGTLPPFITNPKLKELTVDGDLVVEADVSYKGNFRIEISATVRIDLGARFKAREVTIVLATVLKKLDGHILIRIKPPPSNRLWMTFETPPRMELSLEPIVSSRQITYGVVLRAIESRIREVVNETLVLPNWDDMPFMDTIAQTIRGGIWEGEKNGILEHLPKIRSDDTSEGAMTDPEKLQDSKDVDSQISISSTLESDGLGASSSSSTDFKSSSARPRNLRSTSSAAQGKLDSANASAELLEARTPTSVRSLPISSPMRSPLGPINAGESSGDSTEDDGTASLAASTKTAPLLESEKAHVRGKSRELSPEEIATAAAAAAGATNMTKKQTLNQSLNSATAAARSWLASKQGPQTSRTNNPTASKNSLINNNGSSSRAPEEHGLETATENAPEKITQGSKSHTEPMGRGHPLPPLGQPLPQPPKQEKRQTWTLPAASTFASLTKRKPVTGNPSLSERRSKEHLSTAPDHGDARTTPQDLEEFFRRKSSNSSTSKDANTSASVNTNTPEKPAQARRKSSAASSTKSIPAPPLPKRRQRQPSLNLSGHGHGHGHGRRMIRDGEDEGVGVGMGEGLFVVEAPVAERSAPSSPLEGEHGVEHEHEHELAGSERSESPLKGDAASGRASLRSNKSGERERARGVT